MLVLRQKPPGTAVEGKYCNIVFHSLMKTCGIEHEISVWLVKTGSVVGTGLDTLTSVAERPSTKCFPSWRCPPPYAQHSHQTEKSVQWQAVISVLLHGQTEEVCPPTGRKALQLLPAWEG